MNSINLGTVEEYKEALKVAEEEVRQKTHALESADRTIDFLYDISMVLSSTKDEHAIYVLLLEKSANFFGAEISILYFINEEKKLYSAVASYGITEEETRALGGSTDDLFIHETWADQNVHRYGGSGEALPTPHPALVHRFARTILIAPIGKEGGEGSMVQFVRLHDQEFTEEEEVRLAQILIPRFNLVLQTIKTRKKYEENLALAKASAGAGAESIIELEKTKRAILNLLEDTRLAEQREHAQAEELKSALEEIKHIASIADQERTTYFLLLSSIGEGVLVLDTTSKIIILNNVAEQILGFSKEELLGKLWSEKLALFDKRGEHIVIDLFSSLSPGQTSARFDVSIKQKNGSLLPITTVISKIVDTHGEYKGVIATFRDVHEDRALEEARIGFISTASHQLRTPLTSMRWFAEMLLGGDAGEITEEQRHFIERIYQGTDRMINLVSLLLQIARVEAGRIKVEPVPIDLKTITEGVVLALNAEFKAKSQHIKITATPDPLPLIPMEQDYVWQVIQNLLTNANRYSPIESTIDIAITQQGDAINYTVTDRGIGIPENQKDKIFGKFFRADNALKAVPEGSGLGLSLAKSLVEGWGGKIWFNSKEGETTFHVTIPLVGMAPHEGEVKLSV